MHAVRPERGKGLVVYKLAKRVAMDRETYERALHLWPDWRSSIEKSRLDAAAVVLNGYVSAAIPAPPDGANQSSQDHRYAPPVAFGLGRHPGPDVAQLAACEMSQVLHLQFNRMARQVKTQGVTFSLQALQARPGNNGLVCNLRVGAIF